MGEEALRSSGHRKRILQRSLLINFVCTQCGKEFTIAQKLEMDEILMSGTSPEL